MEPYRIVLADDHGMFRAGLKRILAEREGLEIVGEADDGLELLGLLNRVSPHLVILDISMPNLRGIEAINEIKGRVPRVKVLMLTMHRDVEFLSQAMAAGADGYLLKEDTEAEIYSAVEAIRMGKTHVSGLLSAELAGSLSQIFRGGGTSAALGPLTIRERQVVKLIAEGKSNKEVGDALCISVHTVERHRANAMQKLDLRKTADLVKYAIQKGYL
jgi:DNA-binding NarL/FixJ family response regulator